MMDDGIAIEVLEKLKNKLEPLSIKVIIGETDSQFCFQQLNEDDLIIILDASYSGAAAGKIQTYKLEDVTDAYGGTDYQHDLSVFDLIRLYSKALKGYLIVIEAAEIGFGCELSEALKIKFNDICLEVERIIYDILKEKKNARYFSK